MKAINFSSQAQRRALSVEAVRHKFKENLSKGLILGVVSPDKSEIICFEEEEIKVLIRELNGKIDLANLAQQLELTEYHFYLVLQHLLKTGQIDGELTYNSFTSRSANTKLSLQKAVIRKHNHRQEMRRKNK